MITIGVFGLSVMLAVAALRTTPQQRAPRLHIAIFAMPLLLTTVVPVPFALRDSNDWAHKIAVTISRAGVVLSLILVTIGAVLTLRAALAGDRRAAVPLALETAVAGLPAGIVTAYAVLTLL